MKVKDVLELKGFGVNTIDQGATCWEALTRLSELRVGALVVVDTSQQVVGILSERDLLRLVYRVGTGDFRGRAVSEIMTRDVVVGSFNDDLETVSSLMTTHRFRHLPILNGGRLAGIVSIGDVVKAELATARAEAHRLSEYIQGQYPA